jgi:hypothetical protein
MLLLTAGLAAWVLLHERRGPPPNLGGHLLFDYSARVAETGSAVIDLNPDDATAIDLRTASGQVSLRRRADGVWDLSKPIRDRADPALVRQLLEFCRSARIAETLDRDEIRRGRVSAESVGLDDKSAWRLSWRNAAGSEIADIRIGRTAPLGNAAYITVEGERRRPDVYVVTPDLRTLLARPADGFRDPRVTRFSADEVVRAAVRKGEGEVEFSRARAPQKITVRAQDGKPREELDEGTPWFISRPLLNAPASQAAVKDFISMICGAQVSGWLPATDATGGAPEEKPLVEVTLSGPEQSRPDVLSFFADPAGGESVICRSRLRRFLAFLPPCRCRLGLHVPRRYIRPDLRTTAAPGRNRRHRQHQGRSSSTVGSDWHDVKSGNAPAPPVLTLAIGTGRFLPRIFIPPSPPAHHPTPGK